MGVEIKWNEKKQKRCEDGIYVNIRKIEKRKKKKKDKNVKKT